MARYRGRYRPHGRLGRNRDWSLHRDLAAGTCTNRKND